ncbi:integrase core domain-containing protein, partial [Streptococcus thermophilus]
SFFGILKSEMFYGYDKTSKSLNQLEQAIVDYINYYNNKRIKVKLKRKRQSQATSTKPHTIASIHRLIRTMYYLITHKKILRLYFYPKSVKLFMPYDCNTLSKNH